MIKGVKKPLKYQGVFRDSKGKLLRIYAVCSDYTSFLKDEKQDVFSGQKTGLLGYYKTAEI